MNGVILQDVSTEAVPLTSSSFVNQVLSNIQIFDSGFTWVIPTAVTFTFSVITNTQNKHHVSEAFAFFLISAVSPEWRSFRSLVFILSSLFVTIEKVFVNLVDITQILFTFLRLKYFLQIPWAYTASQSYIQRFLLYWICRIFCIIIIIIIINTTTVSIIIIVVVVVVVMLGWC
jgi:hypothetical protein